MAKKTGRNVRRVRPGADVADTRERVTTAGAKASRGTLGDLAEDLGRLLGTAQVKASGWLNQRNTLVEELTKVRDTANRLLRDLAGGAAPKAATTTRGRQSRRGRPARKTTRRARAR